MRSPSRVALDRIGYLIEHGLEKETPVPRYIRLDPGIPSEELKKYLDPEDRFYDQIIGGTNVHKEHSRAA